MTEIQSKLLEMLVWFDRFCRDSHLKYYMLGGTLLGAVRHNGFIPWDDDVDLGMPRTDYDKLATLMGDSIHDGYLLETEYSRDIKYCYTFSKLYDTKTTLCENVKTKLKRGIYLDIFPIDGIGYENKPDMKWYKKIERNNKLYLAKITGVRKGRSIYKNMAIRFVNIIPSFLFDTRKMRIKISDLCRHYSFEESVWAGNLVGNWWEKEIVPSYYFGTPKEYNFEDYKIYGIEHADEYLTAIYGNWNELPPKEKQVSHHDYLLCDLAKSYLDNE